MSKRLQVIIDEDEMRELKAIAKRHRTTVAEWVRRVLRAACRQEPHVDVERKLGAVRMAVRHSFPTGDIQQMLDEIEGGYLEDKSS